MTEQTNKYRNPAQRILNLLDKARSQPDGMPLCSVWAGILGLDPNRVEADPHDLYAQLHLVRNEIDLAEQMMRETNFSSPLYEQYLSRVRKAVSVTNLQSPWGNHKAAIGSDTTLALKYCAEILPSEPDVSVNELQAVLDSVQALRQEIESISLSPSVEAFLLRQLSILDRAIREYPIRGGAAIKRAFQDGFTDWASCADKIDAEVDKKETSKVAGVWGALRKVGEGVVDTDRFATAYIQIIEKGRDGTQALLSLLS